MILFRSAGADPRRLINGSILVLSTAVVIFAGIALWNAIHAQRSAQRIVAATEAVDAIIQASVDLARERGLTAMALGADGQLRPRLIARIADLRREADAAWRSAMDQVQHLIRQSPDVAGVEAALAAADRAHQPLRAARSRADHALADKPTESLNAREWFRIATENITHMARLRDAVSFAVEMPPDLLRMNAILKARAWETSEHAGWTRGLLAYFIASQRPLPSDLRDPLQLHHTAINDALMVMRAHNESRALDPAIRRAIVDMESALQDDYKQPRRDILGAADSGTYPIDALTWWRRVTAAIAAVIDVTHAVSRITTKRATELRDESLRSVFVYAALGAGALALAIFGLINVRRTTNALHHHKELAEVTLHSIGDAVITTDDQATVEYLNPVAEELTGWTTAEARGRPLSEVFHAIDGRTRELAVNPAELALRNAQVVDLPDNTLLVRRDAREVPIDDSAAPIRDRDGNIIGAVLVFYDVTERDPHRLNLVSYQATHDSLTGLVNRREFERRLTELLARTRHEEREHAICYLDLDQFKVVNDTCGHPAGDDLLRQITEILQARIRTGDTLARIGGDEFALLLPDCPSEQAKQVCHGLLHGVRDFRFLWQDCYFDIGASIGLVALDPGCINAEEALSRADAACSLAKEKGRNQVQVYEISCDEAALHHGTMQWVSRINIALEREQFELDCQPILPIGNERPVHCEVLVRMRDENGGRVPPLDFIPAAERYGLMSLIDRRVIRDSAAAIGNFLQKNHDENALRCNINLSGTTLCGEGLLTYVQEQLIQNSIPPELICFEITETAAVSNFDHAVVFMKAMRDIGCQFALDDFGSGLSSFGYLKNLPVNYLKIDGSLVRNVADDPVSHSMVEAIHGVACAMGILTVAEYVNAKRILPVLRRIGIDYVQGFAIQEPLPLQAYLNSRMPRRA